MLVSPQQLIEDAIVLAWDDQQYHLGVELSYFLEQSVPSLITVDADKVKQMLASILASAIHVSATVSANTAISHYDVQFTNSGDIIIYVDKVEVKETVRLTYLMHLYFTFGDASV